MNYSVLSLKQQLSILSLVVLASLVGPQAGNAMQNPPLDGGEERTGPSTRPTSLPPIVDDAPTQEEAAHYYMLAAEQFSDGELKAQLYIEPPDFTTNCGVPPLKTTTMNLIKPNLPIIEILIEPDLKPNKRIPALDGNSCCKVLLTNRVPHRLHHRMMVISIQNSFKPE